jgi:DNA polymerase-3 subunit beta
VYATHGADVTSTGHILVPRAALRELRKILSESQSKVAMHITEGRAVFVVDRVQFVSSTIADPFPPYLEATNIPVNHRVIADRAEFAAGISATALSGSASGFSAVTMTFNNNSARIEGKSEDVSGIDEFDVEYDGPKIEIGSNARFLLDVLGAISTDQVVIGFCDHSGLSPIFVLPHPAVDGAEFVSVTMPVRI